MFVVLSVFAFVVLCLAGAHTGRGTDLNFLVLKVPSNIVLQNGDDSRVLTPTHGNHRDGGSIP